MLLILLVRAGIHVLDAIHQRLIFRRLLLRHLRLLVRRMPFEHGISNLRREQPDRPQCVIIPGDNPVHHVGIAIRIHHGNHRHAHPPRFLDGNLFRIRINHEHGIRKLAHVFDAFQVLIEVLQFAAQPRFFFFRKFVDPAVFRHGLQQLQPLDGFLQRRPVRQRPAQPAVVHKESAAAFRFFGNRFLRLPFRAHKQHRFSLRGKLAHEAARFAKHLEGFLKINNVDAVAFSENIFLHLRIPSPRLVTEVNSGLQQFFHRNFYCQVSS